MKLLLSADWHLREDQPPCRTEDDFLLTQMKKLEFIFGLDYDYVIVAGDIFHKPKPSISLLNYFYPILKKHRLRIKTIPGNHDLPNHNPLLEHNSGHGLLSNFEVIGRIPNSGLSIRLDDEIITLCTPTFGKDWHGKNGNVLILHEYVYNGVSTIPNQIGRDAQELFTQYPKFDLILTGDNHQSFFVRNSHQFLVNPGCLTRQNASEIGYEPSVYIYDTEQKTVARKKVPIGKTVTRGHLITEKQKEQRISQFVTSLKQEVESGVSFEENIKQWMSANEINQDVQNIVWGCLNVD